MDDKKIVRYKLERHKWPDEIQAEKQKSRQRIFMVAFCVVFFTLGFFSSTLLSDGKQSDNVKSEKFDSIYEVMNEKWYFGKDIKNLDEKLIENAIMGMVDGGGDIHTSYMDSENSQRFISSLEGHFVGIGIEYYDLEGQFIVDRVFKNSPAETSGLIKGDIIVEVDGKSMAGKTSDELSEKVKGEPDTKVSLGILRENKKMSLDIIRKEVNSSVFGEVKNDIGVLEINSFSERSGKEVGVYLEDFKTKGIKDIVIDLRNNGGGYLTAAVDIASYFLPEGTVVIQQEDKKGNITEYKTHESTLYTFDDIVFLVDENTASASEVLAACIKEQIGAKLVGTKTYGKGTVQVSLPFKDGSALKYTTAQWLTSKGNKIDGKGLNVDYEVNLDEAVETGVPNIHKDTVVKVDTVSVAAKATQIYLRFLGYDVDRNDEYFSYKGSEALKKYQQDKGLKVNGEINDDVLTSLLSSASIKWHNEKDVLDVQMLKALEVAHE